MRIWRYLKNVGILPILGAVVEGGLSKDDLGVLTESHIAAIPQHAIPHIPPTQFNVSTHVQPVTTGGVSV